MATYATLTINAEDIIGADFDPSRASVWIEANTPHSAIVVDGQTVRVGGRSEKFVNGVATFELVTTNSADNPTSFSYRGHITHIEKGSREQGRKHLTISDFPLIADANLAAIEEAWDGLSADPIWRSDFRDEMEALLASTQAVAGADTADDLIAAVDLDAGSTFRVQQDARLKATVAPDIIIQGPGIDPTGAADSTSAIQTMINANPGRRLRFPVGVFKFSTLTLPDGQSLFGSGWQDYRDRHVFFGNATWNNAASFRGTILRSTATSGVAITIYDTEVNTGNLAEFFLIGPGSGTSTGILLGGTVVTESVVHPVWHNVKVGNFYVGVKMQWVNEGGFHDLTIHGCETGLLFGDYVNQNAFYMLDLQRCDTALLMNATCAANTFYSPIAQVCGTGFVVSGQKTALINPYVEGTTTEGGGAGIWGIDIAGGVGNTVHAPLLSSSTDGLRIRAGANDSTVTAFGYDGNSAPISNAGARSYLQGYFSGLLTDTGTSSTVIDAALPGSPYGPWAGYVPALVGTGWSLGSGGSAVGSYTKIGRTVHFRGKVTFGTGATFGAGTLRITVPWTMAFAGAGTVTGRLLKNGAGFYILSPIFDPFASTASFTVGWETGASNAFAELTGTSPLTLVSGDWIEFQGTYESAA